MSDRSIDRTDRKILAELENDGRLTITELATRVSLSVSRCQRRLRDLERDGVVRGYHADIDAKAIGYGFEVLGFATVQNIDHLGDFDDALARIPNVIEARRLFGDPDYLIRIAARDLEDYQRLYDSHLSKLPGIARMTSTIVMKEVVRRRPHPRTPNEPA